MKKQIKNFIISVIAVALLFVNAGLLCSADSGTSSISVSSSKVEVGQTFTVSVTISADTEFLGYDMKLNYDASRLQYVSGADGGGAGTVRFVFVTTGGKSVTRTATFTAIATGNVTLSLTDCLFSYGLDVPVPGSTANIVVTNKVLSNNANLSSLSIKGGTLSPAFSPNVTSYSVTVPYSVTSGLLYATTADSNASVVVSGKSQLEVGTTVRTVTVTAPSGAVKKYTVSITRLEDDGSGEALSVTLPDGRTGMLVTSTENLRALEGFEAATIDYNGFDVAVLQDSAYAIYFVDLNDSDEIVMCTLVDGGFEPLKYLEINNKFYIFAKDGKSALTGYEEAETEINGFKVECYKSTNPDFDGFFFVHCYQGGKFSYYRYDTLDGVFQRDPGFSAGVEQAIDADQTEKQENTLISRFMSLNIYGKITIIGIAVALIAALILIILLISKIFVSKAENAEDPDEFDGLIFNTQDISEHDAVEENADSPEETVQPDETQIFDEVEFPEEEE